MNDARTVDVGEKILSKNELQAEKNRALLRARGIFCVNLISSPGAGKTYLLERTLDLLRDKVPCAVVTGDQQTDQDAKRLAGRGAPVRQIETVNSCHLDAESVAACFPEVLFDGVKILFIENIGNLICPAAYDLGEELKITLLSTAEGEDKPIKYPSIFSRSDVVVLTKMDLAPHLGWDRLACHGYLDRVAPRAKRFELSARSGEGMDAWIQFFIDHLKR